MPELPEVETFRRMFLPLLNSPLLSVTAPSPTPPKKFLSAEDIAHFRRATITEAERKGKLIRLTLSTGKYVYIHQVS